MISLSGAVGVIIYLIIGALIFGILYGLTVFIARKYPSTAFAMNFVQVIILILAALVAIGFLLSLLTGQQVFRP